MSRILIVDDEDSIRLALLSALRPRHACDEAKSGEAALELLRHGAYDLVLSDLRMGKLGGLEVLKEAKGLNPHCAVMIFTAHGSIENAVEAMKAGADDYLTKPFSLAEVEHRVAALLSAQRNSEERDYLRAEMAESHALVGASEAFSEVKKLISQAGPSEASVLILGETGSGKEGVARALHAVSPRKSRPFIAVNCSAFASGLIESELFGHEKGSFTGAVALRKGRIELADGGTLFLDEVGDLPPETQVKLLRAIESKSFERVGGSQTLKSDFRLISATHRDLKGMAAEGRFRDDLYFRLSVFPLQVPPLRHRGDDVIILAEHFLRKKAPGRHLRLPSEAEALLKSYRWPGNVRELQNVVERAALLSPGEILRLELALSDKLEPGAKSAAQSGKNLAALMDEAEKRLVEEALRLAEGNQSQAAKWLGLERSTLQYKIKKHGLA